MGLKVFHYLRIYTRNMSGICTWRFNPVTGNTEWVLQDEAYDYHQEIARSAFADMLHDTDRNQKYYEGIKRAIKEMHDRKNKAHVLDIGTGTGLLSMMAAKCGADTIVACEAFQPMAKCALSVINENGFAEKIQLISKRSTELTVGENGDLKHRANILVTEVFDTELIGEGALRTFRHALENLLEEDCIVVPSSAVVYSQVVESDLALKWNKLLPLKVDGQVILDTIPEIANCPGAAAVHDLQLSQFSLDKFTPVTKPTAVLRFNWCNKNELKLNESFSYTLEAINNGAAQVVFMWWELVMDMHGEVILSCAPSWTSYKSEVPWRDHWMQAVYYLPREISLTSGQSFSLTVYHDEFSLWFHAQKDINSKNTNLPSPACSCGLHIFCSRTQIGALNDIVRHRKYFELIQKTLSSKDTCVFFSSVSLMGLAAAKLTGAKIIYIETNSVIFQILKKYVVHNHLEDQVVILQNIDDIKSDNELLQQVTYIFGEPTFLTSLLPWDNICFWYMKEELCSLISNSVKVMPSKLTLWAMPVEFEHLWKIRAPLHSVEGFKMTDFDKLIENSSSISDCSIEPQPLWEYPCKPLSKPFKVMELNFTKTVPKNIVETSGYTKFEGCGTCHGLVVWADWHLDDSTDHIISTGPSQPCTVNETVVWDMYTRQGVYFFDKHHIIDPNLSPSPLLEYSVIFHPEGGDICFEFEVQKYAFFNSDDKLCL